MSANTTGVTEQTRKKVTFDLGAAGDRAVLFRERSPRINHDVLRSNIVEYFICPAATVDERVANFNAFLRECTTKYGESQMQAFFHREGNSIILYALTNSSDNINVLKALCDRIGIPDLELIMSQNNFKAIFSVVKAQWQVRSITGATRSSFLNKMVVLTERSGSLKTALETKGQGFFSRDEKEALFPFMIEHRESSLKM